MVIIRGTCIVFCFLPNVSWTSALPSIIFLNDKPCMLTFLVSTDLQNLKRAQGKPLSHLYLYCPIFNGKFFKHQWSMTNRIPSFTTITEKQKIQINCIFVKIFQQCRAHQCFYLQGMPHIDMGFYNTAPISQDRFGSLSAPTRYLQIRIDHYLLYKYSGISPNSLIRTWFWFSTPGWFSAERLLTHHFDYKPWKLIKYYSNASPNFGHYHLNPRRSTTPIV